MRAIFRSALFLLLLPQVLSCSLSPFPPVITLSISSPKQTEWRGGRAGPDPLSSMKCFGVVIGGAPGAVTSSQIAFRSPACLGLSGAFHGPYTYAEITGGVALSLPTAAYQFSVVGFHGVTDCGSNLSALYNSTVAAENYAVAGPVSVDLSQTTRVSLDAASYVASQANNRTPSCLPQTLDCSGAAVCDTFTDPDFTTLANHFIDGTSLHWAEAFVASANIVSNAVEIVPNNGIGTRAILSTISGVAIESVSLIGTFGASAVRTGLGAVIRLSSANDFAVGEILREAGSSLCTLQIVEMIAASTTVRASKSLNFADYCSNTESVRIDFSIVANAYRLVVKDQELTYPTVSPLLIGTGVGFSFQKVGASTALPSIDFFRANAPQ